MEQNPNVQAAPNESRIRGRIMAIEDDPDSPMQCWQIEIRKSFDVGGFVNLTRSRVGDSILIYVPPETGRQFRHGDFIEASVTYQGDETGGVFFLKEDSIRKTDPNLD